MTTFRKNEHTDLCTEHMETHRIAYASWQKAWPNACEMCHAQGYRQYPATRTDPEEIVVCDDCRGNNFCPRCGAYHITLSKHFTAISPSLDDAPFVCYACGWTGEGANDAEPPSPECDCWPLREERYPLQYATPWDGATGDVDTTLGRPDTSPITDL